MTSKRKAPATRKKQASAAKAFSKSAPSGMIVKSMRVRPRGFGRRRNNHPVLWTGPQSR